MPVLCSRGHELHKCEEFRKKIYEEGVKIVRRIKSAIIVLNRDTLQEGASKESIVNCQNVVGNTTLCYILRSLKEKFQCRRINQCKLTRNHHVIVMCTKRSNVYLRIVPVKVIGTDGKTVKTYALLDSGSVKGDRCNLEVGLQVSSLDNEHSVLLEGVWSVERLPVTPKAMPVADDVKKWPHLHDLEFPTIDAEEVVLLIGANAPEALGTWVLEERRGNRGEPCAVKSLLGWTLLGPSATVKENNIGMVPGDW